MPIDPQRALEGYLRALSYDPHEAESKSAPRSGAKSGAKPEAKSGAASEPSRHSTDPAPAIESGHGPAPGSAPRKAPVPAPATEPAPAAEPALAAGPGLLWRLLSLRRASATAEKPRRA
ncbi:hypothetical protein ACFYWU_26295 [Streptomyces chrestomyceticus]|uniref:hypothetical protein n=1 Tax=Streptomyces chrestomyceticus TaxID=68185 RepID=UPI0036BC02F0